MDIWGTKTAKLQKELDQAKIDLQEVRDLLKTSISDFEKIVSDVAKDAHASHGAGGASILFMQNRKQPSRTSTEIG